MSESQPTARDGVLLINLGTPEAPTAPAIRRYLREFLSDRRVVNLPRVLWLPVLYGFILPWRPRRLTQAYAAVWTAEGSPLRVIAARQAAALKTALGGNTLVALGLRYGRPAIAEALDALLHEGASRIVVLPLYPQYSATTTASALDTVGDWQRTRSASVALHIVNDYHDDAGYIAALADHVHEHWHARGRGPAHLLMSFHGIPQRYVDAGDPYADQCRRTSALLAQKLGLADTQWTLAFQSRLGKAQWLQPYTGDTLARLPERGIKDVGVICPGFSADCLETLEEIGRRGRETFLTAGGLYFDYLPALNAHPAHIRALTGIVSRQLS